MSIPVLYFLVSGSAITDILRGKIFNRWLMFGAVAGLVLGILENAQGSWSYGILRAAVTMLVLLPLYLIRGIGGGDLKLFSVIAFFLPGVELMICVILAFVLGAAAGLVKIIINRKLNQTIHFALPILASVLLVTQTI